MMTRLPVASSMMVSVGYDAAHAVLEIEFRSGDIYEYRDVPELVYRALLKAPSKGRFFHTRIDSKFHFVQINTREDADADDTDGIAGWPGLE
jgi:KTSC domain